jgi:hypothetical protein
MISNKDEAIKIIRDLRSLTNLLLDDLDTSNDLLREYLLQSEKIGDLSRKETLIRIQIRLTVSFIEAVCYAFRRVAYQFCNLSKKPIPPNYKELDDAKKKVQLKDKIKGSLRFIAHVTGVDCNLDTSSPRWQKVCELLDKRHHLTHPNKIEDLKVSVKDLENDSETLLWFLQYLYRLLEKPYPEKLEELTDDDIKAGIERFRHK